MYRIFLLLFCVITLSAEELELDNLLKEYAQAEELYLKTKRESGGHLVVYSREELERMQAYTLEDILKTIRMHTLQTSFSGMVQLSRAGQMSIAPIKVYINDQELNSASSGNALFLYGNMDLYFIDHIEIYLAGNAIAFGNEPGGMIVRLYTKDPDRENSSSLQVSADSRSGGSARGTTAGRVGDYTYLFYAHGAKNTHETYALNNHELSRDGNRYQLYFKVSKEDDFDIELNGMEVSTDIFKGFGMAPLGEGTVRTDGYLRATKFFPDRLKVALSLSSETMEVENSDSIGFKVADNSDINTLESNVKSTVYKAMIEKKIVEGRHDLLLGAQFERKLFNVESYKNDGVEKPMFWGPDRLDIYMAYAEELYNINENHLVALSGKVDHYENSFGKSSDEYLLRIGYIALLEERWKLKLFGIRGYIYPSFIQTTYAPTYNPNPDLESTKTLKVTGEVTYNTQKDTVTFGLGHGEAEDAVIFDPDPIQKKYVNSDKTGRFQMAYLRAEHRFDIDNKIIAEWYKIYRDKYVSPGSGVSVRMFNKLWEADIYNELLYHADYESVTGMHMDKGYNYTLGVIYPFGKQLQLKLKGENLLDKASVVPVGTLEVPAVDRRFTATLEYTF